MFVENKKKIVVSKKIFQYDPIKKNNMYDYIKDEENLLFLAKLENGGVIGSFSASSWKNPSDPNEAFIFAISPHTSGI